MDEKIVENPFDELPEALVEEMLDQCEELGENLSKSFQKLYNVKNDIRKEPSNLSHNIVRQIRPTVEHRHQYTTDH